MFTRNFLLDLENGNHCTPILPARDVVKQFSSGAPPPVRDPAPTLRKLPHIPPHFCNTSPYPNNPLETDSDTD
jgi:hypothetical protein